MQKILTISIAAYNVQDYIRQCLDSFVIPELLQDIEVLVIDDGSKDSTPEIVEEYVKRYPDTFRLIRKENGGHGSTVNRGMQEAAGRYFKTVDGDDWVDRQGFIGLVNFLKMDSETPDVVVTDYYWVRWDSEKIMKRIRTDFRGKTYQTMYSFEDIADDLYLNMHAVTIRTKLLQECHVRLTEHCFYVDAQYVLYPVPYMETVVFLQDPVYMYRLGMDGQSMNLKNMQKNCADHEKVLESIINLYHGASECNAEKKQYLAKGIARLAASQVKIYLSYTPNAGWKKKIVDLDKRLKEEVPQAYDACNNRAVWLLRKSGYSLYGLASRLLRMKG